MRQEFMKMSDFKRSMLIEDADNVVVAVEPIQAGTADVGHLFAIDDDIGLVFLKQRLYGYAEVAGVGCIQPAFYIR